MLISFIVSPNATVTRTSPRPPPPNPESCADDRLEELIMHDLHQQNDGPIDLWSLVDRILANVCPSNRAETRELKGRVLSRVGRLIRRKAVERVDRNMIRLCRPTVPKEAQSSRRTYSGEIRQELIR